MRNLKSFLENLTHHAGVYQMLGAGGEVLYVGKAKDLKKRVSSYFNRQAKDPKTTVLVKHVKNIDITVTTSEHEAVLLECNLIKVHKPRYNILLRDDKSYPYIVISSHPFPRIDSYRGQRKKDGQYFGPYPSGMAVREAIDLLQKIFKLRTCRDSFFQSRTRPCLLYQIGRCTGPCVDYISEEDYARNVELAILFLEGKSDIVIETLQQKMAEASDNKMYEQAAEIRDQIVRLRQLQDKQYVSNAYGHADVIGIICEAGVTCAHLLTIRDGQVLGSRTYFPVVPAHAELEEIASAFIKQHYLVDASHVQMIPKEILINQLPLDHDVVLSVLSGQAGHKVKLTTRPQGDRKKWLEMAITSAKHALANRLYTKMNIAKRIEELQTSLQLASLPARIECFDISHSMGEATVASCVVFNHLGAVKSDYRRFNITGITPGDDVAAMRQAVSRRFSRLQSEQAKLPDLIMIDGGRTQLGAAASALAELNLGHIQLMGISKGPKRKAGYETLHVFGHTPLHLAPDSPTLHFIQQIRDEAHRFAITGHRARRDKKRQKSVLETIPGIGPGRRRDLLRYFGGIQGVAHASLDELKKVPGISHSIAERIFAALHDAIV